MIRHVVLFRWALAADPEEVEAALERIRHVGEVSPSCLRFTVTNDLGIRLGNFDSVVVADFEDEGGFLSYANHPEHLRVIEDNDPIVAAKAAVQYELSGSSAQEGL